MTRIAISGGNGMLGTSLVPYLSSLGHSIFLLGRAKNSHVVVDLSARDLLFDALAQTKPDVIVNLAALTDVDECERNPALAYNSNSLIVDNIASWIGHSAGNVHLIQVSTDQVYSGKGPHGEEDVCPVNYYAFSKLIGEAMALRVSSTVLRTNFFGASRCAERRSLSDWLVDVLLTGKPANVFSNIEFSPVSMTTLCKVLGVAIDQKICGVFNVGSNGGLSKADFAFEIAKALSLSPEHLNRMAAPAAGLRARRPTDMRMISSRFEECFGFKLPTLLKEIENMRDEYALPAAS